MARLVCFSYGGRRLVLGQSLLLASALACVAGCANSNGGKPVDGAVERAGAQTQPVGAWRVSGPEELTLDLGDKVTMRLVRIPSGKFLMGSPETETDRLKDVETQHEATISKAFYMGVTHVTVEQFAAFVKDSGYKTDAEKIGWSGGEMLIDSDRDFYMVTGASWHSPPFGQIDLIKGDHPVVQVSWNDANVFCDWLSKRSGRTVVLPTEAQWEYACRAGTKTAYPWGDNPDDGTGWANCADQSLRKRISRTTLLPSFLQWGTRGSFYKWDDGFVLTSPVGTFKANAFGLYDMIGNANQWCRDLGWDDYAKTAVTDPMGPATRDSHIDSRVTRGGSWNDSGWHCRSASRGIGWQPYSRDSTIGFRVVVLEAGK